MTDPSPRLRAIQELCEIAIRNTATFQRIDDGREIDYNLPLGEYWLLHRLGKSVEWLLAELARLTQERKQRRYAHMCRDEHQEIGHNDSSSEMCPLCRAIAERDEARRERDEARATLGGWLEANAPGGWINDLRAERETLRGYVQHTLNCDITIRRSMRDKTTGNWHAMLCSCGLAACLAASPTERP